MRRIIVVAVLSLCASSGAAQEPKPTQSPVQPTTQDAKKEKRDAQATQEKAKQDAEAAKEADKAAQPTGEKVAMSGSAEQELTQIDREWSQAGVRADASVLERVLADDYSGTGASGNAVTKAEAIAESKSGATKLESNDTDNYNVRVFGDTAVMTHDGVRKGQRAGQAFTERYRSLHVFVKRGGRWQVVASQGLTLPQQ